MSLNSQANPLPLDQQGEEKPDLNEPFTLHRVFLDGTSNLIKRYTEWKRACDENVCKLKSKAFQLLSRVSREYWAAHETLFLAIVVAMLKGEYSSNTEQEKMMYYEDYYEIAQMPRCSGHKFNKLIVLLRNNQHVSDYLVILLQLSDTNGFSVSKSMTLHSL